MLPLVSEGRALPPTASIRLRGRALPEPLALLVPQRRTYLRRLPRPRGTTATAPAELAVLAHASADLARACTTLATRAARPRDSAPPPLIALRHAGNCLAELDIFLARMIGAGAALFGLSPADLALVRRQRSARRGLARIGRRIGAPAIDTRRLAAIASIRSIGKGRRGAGDPVRLARDWALASGLAHSPRTAMRSAGPPIEVCDRGLAGIARHYLELATALLAQLAQARRELDFSAATAHIAKANVACDGI